MNDGIAKDYLPDSEPDARSQFWNDTKGGCKLKIEVRMPGAGLNNSVGRKAHLKGQP